MTQINEVQQRQQYQGKIKTFMMWAVLVLVSGVLVAAPGWAGGKGKHHGHDPEKKLQKLTEKLELTEEQQAKVKPILEQKHQQLQELHKQMKEVRMNARAQIEAQLTPEQVGKFKELGKKRKQSKKGKKGKHGKKHKNEHSDGDTDTHGHD
ncbi:periplasmic heavy metal sensor [Nitrospira sp. M1]